MSIENQTTVEDRVVARNRTSSEVNANGRWSVTHLVARHGLLITWLAVIAVFGILRPDTFLSTSNFQSIFSSQSILLILGLGIMPALIAGAYDMSVAGTLGVSLVMVGWLNVTNEWPILLAVAVALAIGLLVGIVNGIVVVVLGVDSIVATLGMGTALAGAALGINNISVGGISSALVDFSRWQLFGLQGVFYYALALTVGLWYVGKYTVLGRQLFVAGASPNVALLSGIRVHRIRFGTLVFSGVTAAAAGVLLAGLLGAADPTIGPTYLLPAFAGVFLGSTSVTPGRFNAWGTFIGVYFLATGIAGLELVDLSGWVSQVFYGGSLVIAVVFSRVVGRTKGA